MLGMQAQKNELTNLTSRRYLSQQRQLFFRQDGTPVASSITTANMPSVTTNNLSTSVNNFTPTAPISSIKKEAPPLTYAKENPTRNADDYVGFANLPNQVYRKAVKKGFEFTLMVVGEAGLGKSTLINSMFLTDIYSKDYPGPSIRPKKTVQVEMTKVLLKENGVNLTLTIVDTPGFGDAVDNSECWQPVIDYIESKYEEYLNAESRVHRSIIPDSRVHCCLYFIAPSGHSLKPLDVEFMRRLHDKVNIIPLIAKADTMTPEECAAFRRRISGDIDRNKIKIYDFPYCDDEDENKMQKYLKEHVPFAVVGSNTVIEVDGKRLRGRKYPWGIAEVENMEHCDFIALRNMLLRSNMQDLKDVTNNVHYENYRYRKLAAVAGDGKRISNKNPLAQMEEERKEHEQKMLKMEQELEQVFELKVREKMQKLKDSEADLQRRCEQTKKFLDSQRKELQDKWKALDSDKASFDFSKDEELLRRMSADLKDQNDAKEKKKEKKKGIFQWSPFSHLGHDHRIIAFIIQSIFDYVLKEFILQPIV